MLKRVQHDSKKCVIPNWFRNLEFENDNESIALVFVLRSHFSGNESSPTGLSDNLPVTHDHFTPDHR
jgi:hypothetical protein